MSLIARYIERRELKGVTGQQLWSLRHSSSAKCFNLQSFSDSELTAVNSVFSRTGETRVLNCKVLSGGTILLKGATGQQLGDNHSDLCVQRMKCHFILAIVLEIGFGPTGIKI